MPTLQVSSLSARALLAREEYSAHCAHAPLLTPIHVIVVQALLDSEVADVISRGHRCRHCPAIFNYTDTVSAVLKRLGSRESVEEKLCGLVLRKSTSSVANDASASQEEVPSAASADTGSRQSLPEGQSVFIQDVLGFIDLNIILQTALRSTFFQTVEIDKGCFQTSAVDTFCRGQVARLTVPVSHPFRLQRLAVASD